MMNELAALRKRVAELETAEAECKKAEETLRRYRNMVESAQDAVFFKDLESRYLIANNKTLQAFGLPREEVIGRNDCELANNQEAAKEDIEADQLVFKTGKSQETTKHITLADGHKYWFHAIKVPQFDDRGGVVGLIGIARDITESKQAEEEARCQRDYFRSLFEGSPEAVATLDLQKHVLDVNAAFVKLFGHALEDIKGKDILSFILPQGKEKEGKDINLRASQGEIVAAETVRRAADGREIPVSLLGAPVMVEGRQVGLLAIYRDISRRKRAEEDLEASRQELRELAEHLQSAREEERTGIARELHDDIGQALTAIKIDLSWLRKELPKDEALLLEKTRGMLRVADSAIQTVRRISSELRPGILDDLGLTAAIQWYAGEFEQRAGVKCEVSVEHEVIILEQDRSTAVFRIFQEALTNVARHAAATRIRVNLGETDGKLVLEIADDGKGITARQISGRKSFGLMGMRESAAFLGGELQISGGQDKGMRVTVSIPLRREGRSTSP